MPSKYATISNVRCDENMYYDVLASEGLSSLMALFFSVKPLRLGDQYRFMVMCAVLLLFSRVALYSE